MNLDETERHLIACLLAEPAAYHDVADRLTADHFHEPICRAIWAGLVAVHTEGVFDLALVEARAARPSEDVDLMARIYGLAAAGKKLGDVKPSAFAAPLVERHIRGRVSARLAKLAKEVTDPSKPAAEIVQAGIRDLDDIASSSVERKTTNLGVAVEEIRSVYAAARDKGANPVISTGMPEVDEVISGGLMPGLIVVAGRSGHGKTQFCMQLAKQFASQELPGIIAQSDMSPHQMASRVVAQHCGVSVAALMRYMLSPEEEEAIITSAMEWKRWPLFLEGDPRQTIEELHARWRAHKARFGLAFGVIDAAKRIPTRAKHDNQAMRTSYVFDYAYAMAMDLGIPILLVAHPKHETARDPTLAMTKEDIFGGGNSKESADTVIIIHRPEIELAQTEPEPSSPDYQQWQDRMNAWRGKAELIGAKTRYGRDGQKVVMNYDGGRGVFVPSQQAIW